MIRLRYETILGGLDEALAFCRSLGLGNYVEMGRFGEYRRIIAQLPQNGQPCSPEDMMACIESMEFSDVLQHVRHCDHSHLQEMLKAILTGPILQSDESPTSNKARNLLFELNIAAKLSRAQLQPSLGEPDLICDIQGKRLFIACKRPFAQSKVKSRIKDAKEQIRRAREGAPPGARGVIAISLSKIMNRGDQLFVYSGERQGQDALSERLHIIADGTENVWRAVGDKVIGILFHIITAGVDEAAKIYVQADQSIACPIARKGTYDYRVFRRLYEALEAIVY